MQFIIVPMYTCTHPPIHARLCQCIKESEDRAVERNNPLVETENLELHDGYLNKLKVCFPCTRLHLKWDAKRTHGARRYVPLQLKMYT